MNPKQILMNMMKKNTNPLIKELYEKGQKGDTKSIEDFARNFFKQQGRDFDSEFTQFKNNFK